jgi:hypothetical protein
MVVFLALAAAAGLGACASTPEKTTSDERRDARPPVASAHPFEVEGRVSEVSKGVLGQQEGVMGIGGSTLVISRDDAPQAALHVTEETRISLDDRPAKLADLREGDEVRAKFDFDGSAPVAIEIDATAKR